MKALFQFIIALWKNKVLLWELTKKDLKQRYLGSYLGVLWAFIQPTITVFIFWFVFQVGFKSMPVDNFPFILWLICGMFPWFFFSDAWTSATGAIISNSFLVKKVVFKVSLLPIIQIMSALVINIFFNIILLVLFACYGHMPTIHILQIFYYQLGLIILIFGLSLITSSLAVFSRDIQQLVSMVIQFGFWATPIFWSLKIIPSEYQFLLKCNPMYYITNGYRDTFIAHRWFWELGFTNIGFWLVTFFIAILGVVVFKKLRPHFADVL